MIPLSKLRNIPWKLMLGRVVPMNFSQKKRLPNFRWPMAKAFIFGARLIHLFPIGPNFPRKAHPAGSAWEWIDSHGWSSSTPSAPVDLMIDPWMTLRVCCFSLEGRLTNVYIYIYILYTYSQVMLYIDRNQISYVLMYMLHVHLSKGSTNTANMLIPGLFFWRSCSAYSSMFGGY